MQIRRLTQEMLANWENGMLAQIAMPNLTPDEREFVMTGITADVWDKTFNEVE